MVNILNNKYLITRNISYHIIKDSFTKNKQLSIIMNEYLINQDNHLTNIDKRFITMLVQGTVRLSGRLDWKLRKIYNGDYDKLKINFKILLRIGTYQLLYMDKVPKHAAVDTTVELSKKIHKNRGYIACS